MNEGWSRRWAALAVAAAALAAACLTSQPVSAAQLNPPSSPSVHSVAPHPSSQRSTPGSIRNLQTGSTIPWIWQNPRPSGNPLYAITCVNTSFCWAAGYDDIAFTQDGGAHWARASSYTLFGISCPDISHCVAVGNGGVVVTTNGVSATSIQSLNVAFLAGVSCPSGTTVCYTIGAGGFVFKSTDRGLTWVNQQQVSLASFYAISCADATHCVAVGANGLAAFTVNGSTWAAVNTATTHSLYGISCPTITNCLAAGLNGDVTSTSSGGSSWNFGSIGVPVALFGVSCASTMACYMAAADGTVYGRDAFGGTVEAHGSTGENGSNYAISCPAPTTCFAAGDYGTIAMTSNGGSGWTAQSTGLGSTGIIDITCPSATVCFLIGINGLVGRTMDGGATWTAQATGAQALLAISCASTSLCVAVGFNGAAVFTSNGGTTWTAAATVFGTTQLNSVSCVPSTSTCYLASSSQVSKSTDGGNHWAGLPVFGQRQNSGISCPAIAHCFVSEASITGEVDWTTDDATWNSFDLISDPSAFNRGPLNAIGCPDVNTCYAVGNSALIATTTDGGQNWRTDGPNSTANLSGVNCPSAGVCYVAGSDTTILHTTDYGADWDVQMSGSGPKVACSSTTTCLAGAGANSITKTTTAGTAWTVQRPSGNTTDILAISCFGFSNCYAAANGSVLASHDGGGTWATHSLNTTDLLWGISCASASVCYAAGWPSALYKSTDGGGTWTRQSNATYGSDRTFTSISCSDATHCVAVGDMGFAISTADGSTWSAETTGTTQNLWAVFCPSPSPVPGQCVAVGSNGTVVTRASGSWSPQSSGTTNTLYAVECAHSPSTCYAVGRNGTVLMTANGGSSWKAQTSGTTQNLHGIDCMQVNRCIAVGNMGAAIITTDGSTWVSLPVPTPNWLRGVSFKDTDQVIIAGLGSTLIGIASCTSAVITSNLPSPQPGGTAVTFTAGALGPYCSNPLFEWWLWSSTTNLWSPLQPYGPNGQFTLDTTGMTPGTYTIDVWVESQGSILGPNAYEAFAIQSWVVGGCDWATVVANPGPGPTQITYDTQSGGAGCAPAQYQFWLYSVVGGWQILQAYSANGHYTLDTSTFPIGTYTVDIWVKQRGSPLQYETWALSTFAAGACGNNATTTVRTIPATSPVPVGTSVTVVPSSNCSVQPFYKFFLYPGTQNAWQVLQDYDRPPFISAQWDTTGWKTGTQSIVVHVLANRPTTSNPAPDTWAATSVSVLGCSSAVLTVNQMSPQPIGTPITLTASANSSCPQPQFQFWSIGPAGSWRIAQDWSPTSTFNWNTTNVAPGTYAWVVYVRQTGSGNSLDTFAEVSVVVS